MQQEKLVDFILVGSGISGLNAALTLSPFGNVLIITKRRLHDSSTYLAQGGIAAALKNEDSHSSHFQDTMNAGYYHNKKRAVEVLVKGGKDAVKRLEQLGVPFDKYNDEYVSSYEAAHSYPRILHATDFTGRKIEKTLIANVLKEKAIEIWEDTTALDLIVKDKQSYGIRVLKKNKPVNIFSRTVILATGGIGQIYQWTTNPQIATGDGIAIAHRAEAKIKDLEFIQFHPTALAEKTSPLLLLSEALRGEGAILVNAKHERFMPRYHLQKELAPRDVVARAIFDEQKNGPVFLDISHKDKKFIIKRFPNISKALKKLGFDLTSQPVPVTPAVHFLCGGIATDIYGRTSIKNLFAYGEVAATGVHGANRLASNSLLEGMVFSEQIKHCIGELPRKPQKITVIARPRSGEAIPFMKLPRSISIAHNDEKQTLVPSPYHLVHKKIRNEIKTIMWQHVGIIRTPEGIQTAQKELEKLQTKQLDNETKNMVTVALLITKAAQKRKKSLGTHYVETNSKTKQSSKSSQQRQGSGEILDQVRNDKSIKINSKHNLLQYKKAMPQIKIHMSIVIFRIDSDSLCVYVPNDKLPSETLSEAATLDEQVKEMFYKNLGFPPDKNYIEQLYTFSKDKKEVTIVYYILLGKNESQTESGKNWKKVSNKKFPEQEIISYALQRLRWKIEYTNVVYSFLPKTFTLSDLQKTYEIILGKKLDKRNFRKKILSLAFLKLTGEKRVINARPAQMYTFTKRTPQLVKVFS